MILSGPRANTGLAILPGSSSFYISEGSRLKFPINGGVALPAGVDRLAVALHWPEEDHVSGADVVMVVRSTCGPWLERWDYSYDTKKRVYVDDTDVGGSCFEVEIEAFFAPASNWYGGLRRKVYLAYYYEDSSRDDLWAGIQ